MNQPKLRFKEFRTNWQPKKLGDIADTLINNSFTRSMMNYDIKNTFNIHYGDIHTKFQTVLDLSSNTTTIPYVNLDVNTQKIAHVNYCKNGDLIIADASEDYKGIANSIEILHIKDKQVLAGLHTILLRPHNNIFAPCFLGYYFNNNPIKHQIRKIAVGFKVYSVSKAQIKKLHINIPTIKEQEKIVNILTLIDKKINLLTIKKSKLKDYKKTVTKKIFTLDIRFQGFTEKWNSVSLGEISHVKKGKQLNKEHLFPTGHYYVLNGGRNPSGYYNKYNTEKHTISISEGGESCGYVTYNKTNFWAGGHCYILLDIDINVDTIFLYNYLKSIEFKIMRLRVGSGLPNIQIGSISSLTINIPTIAEQEKIANFLWTLDTRINATIKLLDRTIQYKKYLLQNMFV